MTFSFAAIARYFTINNLIPDHWMPLYLIGAGECPLLLTEVLKERELIG